MDILKYILTPQIMYGIIFLIAIGLLYFRIMDISVKEKIADTSRSVLIRRLEKDEQANRKNIQMERIGQGKTGSEKRYRDLIQNVVISLNLQGVTVENFTSMFVAVGILAWLAFSAFFSNVFIGALVAIPTIFAVIALVLSFTKISVRANDDRVMDSLDIICPSIEHSVVAAIRQNIDSFDSKIRKEYIVFLQDIDARDMSLREAITDLNRRLGPRFDEFARKALIFHDSGEEGMAEIFMDIVEVNAFTRSINARADVVYQDNNFNMISSAAVVMAFLYYTYNNVMTENIMKNTLVGKMSSAVSIAIIIMMYAYGQITQMSIDYDQIKDEK